MATPRQQHFLQAKYLEGFLDPGEEKLWCYARGRSNPYPAIPRKLARKRDFYQLPNATPDRNLEEHLGQIEVPGLTALRELVANTQPFPFEKRIQLARYVAYQEMRVPYSRELIREQSRESMIQMLKIMDRSGTELAEIRGGPLMNNRVLLDKPQTITRAALQEQLAYMDKNPESFDIALMVSLADDMTIFYSSMHWEVLYASPRHSFITSDCPVVRMFKEPGGDDALLHEDCSVCFPLSSSALLIMKHDRNILNQLEKGIFEASGQAPSPISFRRISQKVLHVFNHRTIEFSNIWCYSGSKSALFSNLMQKPTRRRRPVFIQRGNLIGTR